MKRTLKILAIMLVITLLTVSGVKAATSSTLANDLYSKLSAYGLTAGDKVRIERYLSENPVTDDQANTILAQADEIVYVMDSEGTKNIKALSSESQALVKSFAQTAANVAGLNLTFTDGEVKVYDNDGNLVDTVTVTEDGKLAYTGNNVNTAIVASSIAVIALAAIVIAKKEA